MMGYYSLDNSRTHAIIRDTRRQRRRQDLSWRTGPDKVCGAEGVGSDDAKSDPSPTQSDLIATQSDPSPTQSDPIATQSDPSPLVATDTDSSVGLSDYSGASHFSVPDSFRVAPYGQCNGKTPKNDADRADKYGYGRVIVVELDDGWYVFAPTGSDEAEWLRINKATFVLDGSGGSHEKLYNLDVDTAQSCWKKQ